ncbi:MAG: SDR family oxidoreductase [Candidatus Nanopelagicales bacterium]
MTAPTNAAALATLRDGCLQGRTALVTGGGSGIGRATAVLLARLGARVAVVGRRLEALAETAEVARELPHRPELLPVSCDVRETDQVDAMLDRVLDAFGRVDLLVNNAGGQFVSPAEQITPKGFRAVTRLNLDATWYVTTQVAARSMIPAGYGKVVSVTMTPRRGMPGMAHSSAARAAVESLTRTLAVEWGRHGIRLAAVAPGIVHTPAWERYGLDPDQIAQIVPLARLQAADEVAAVIAFLLSPAGDYITGTTVVADGGLDVSGPGSAFGAS